MGKNGVILIDKPAGMTSRTVVDRVMRQLKVRKAGHFGTLDPFATGLLCIGIGQGTKLLPFMHAHDKEYLATIGFDRFTDTDDLEGETLKIFENVAVDREAAAEWFKAHLGWSNQIPPDYCAQKQNGKPLYKLKRENQEVKPREKQVHIAEAEILEGGEDWLRVRIVCSRGTYIRAIARDLGTDLGCGGYLKELRRLRSEGFSVEQAMRLDDLIDGTAEPKLLSLADALAMPRVHVTRAGQMGILDGNAIQQAWLMDDLTGDEDSFAAMVNEDEELLCVARIKRCGGIAGYIERGFNPG